MCCSVFHCVAVCCSVLQYLCRSQVDKGSNVLQCVAVCCSVLQCVAVCCSTCSGVKSTKDRMCCSMLQYVVVCCSVLHCVAVPAQESVQQTLEHAAILQCLSRLDEIRD